MFVDLSCDESLTDCPETGYAAIAGMTEDLQLTGLRYNIIAALFYVRKSIQYMKLRCIYRHQIPYCLVEVPSYVFLFVA